MWTPLHWIKGPWKGRLAIMPRPRGGDWIDGEVRRWRNAGVHVLVSLLTSDENTDLQLEGEAQEAAAAGLEFMSFPIEDRQVPTSLTEARLFVETLRERLTHGRNVAIHCRQGVGRSGMMAVAALVAEGLSPDAAIAAVSAARRSPVPETGGQLRWIQNFASIEAGR